MSTGTLAQLRAGALLGAARVDLSADLTAVPREILTLADSLETLNLSGNQLEDLPEWLPELGKLRVLFCSKNPFRHVPEVLGRCPALEMIGFKSCRLEGVSGAALPPRLRWLILTDNLLTELPAELGSRSRLQKLMLSGNRLTALPESMAGCGNLELLRLASNRFATLPEWLMELPRLAWLALAGNPLTETSHGAEDKSEAVPWGDLIIGTQLGEGASGQIFAGTWCRDAGAGGEAGRELAVAVKLFKGAMTSDGLPACEMGASLAVGDHPALIGTLGRVVDHPEGLQGLVMRRIDSRFRPLAGPPSLESCTRDIYAPELALTGEETLKISRTIAQAGARLHARHLLHGDLYAHNILQAPGGEALLGDFGAAWSTAGLTPESEAAAQRLEVRAFGVLLEELLVRTLNPESCPGVATLRTLAVRCADPAAGRPQFTDIVEILEKP